MPSKHGYRGYGAARTPGSQDRGLQDEKLSAGKMYNAKTGKFIKDKKLSPKQKKIASLAGNRKKIDGPDFKKLQAMKRG